MCNFTATTPVDIDTRFFCANSSDSITLALSLMVRNHTGCNNYYSVIIITYVPYPCERGPWAKIGGWADIRDISITFRCKERPDSFPSS